MSRPDLSVVIPAYNEAERLPRSLERILEYLRSRGGSWEVVVVDDGSRDETAARAMAVGSEAVRVLRNETNRGKGYSVRRGMLEAGGALRLMSDADLSTPIEEVERLEKRLAQGCDVVIASRALPESNIEVRQPWYRENMGRLFNLLVQVLLLPGLHDTQCGFKLFTAAAAEAAFSPARLDGFSFDVEALYIARRRGLRIAEVPVTWRNDAATRVGSLKGFLAFVDLLEIRLRAWGGGYGL
jgi:dolichyl-phosphate beta-glucosyltransferase